MGKLSVFGDSPAGLVPFEDEEQGERVKLASLAEKTVIFKVRGKKDVKTNKYGVKPAIEADLVVIAAGKAPQEFPNQLIFNAAPVQQLERKAGQTIVAKVELYETDQGGEAPKLVAPSAKAIAAAQAYLEEAAGDDEPPF